MPKRIISCDNVKEVWVVKHVSECERRGSSEKIGLILRSGVRLLLTNKTATNHWDIIYLFGKF